MSLNKKEEKVELPKDPASYQLKAEKEEALAQFQLGIRHLEGSGVEKDLKEAVRLFDLAATKKLAKAQYMLGMCYQGGITVEKDIKEAARLYRLAANQGLAEAQCALADYYR